MRWAPNEGARPKHALSIELTKRSEWQFDSDKPNYLASWIQILSFNQSYSSYLGIFLVYFLTTKLVLILNMYASA